MMTKFGLKQTVIEKMNRIFMQYPKIETVIIYGSRAKGNHKPGSDIDLTMVGKGISHQDLMEISIKLDDLLLPYTIDLSIHHQIDNQDLRAHIQRVGLIFYSERLQP
jgi:uncharacterized protein